MSEGRNRRDRGLVSAYGKSGKCPPREVSVSGGLTVLFYNNHEIKKALNVPT